MTSVTDDIPPFFLLLLPLHLSQLTVRGWGLIGSYHDDPSIPDYRNPGTTVPPPMSFIRFCSCSDGAPSAIVTVAVAPVGVPDKSPFQSPGWIVFQGLLKFLNIRVLLNCVSSCSYLPTLFVFQSLPKFFTTSPLLISSLSNFNLLFHESFVCPNFPQTLSIMKTHPLCSCYWAVWSGGRAGWAIGWLHGLRAAWACR